MTRRPGGRTNGAGRGPKLPRPRGSNAGPTRGGCGRTVAVVLVALALVGECVWSVTR